MNLDERYNYNYNRMAMERRIKKLCIAARGTNVSILPNICKEDGKFSSKKAFEFIKHLLDCGDKLGTKEMKFYRDFFYCTFRCYANERIIDYEVYEQFRPCETFQDILDKALMVEADKWVNDKEKLLNYEFREIEDFGTAEMDFVKSFFIAMDLCYRRVTGRELETIDEEGFAEYKKGQLYAEYEERLQESYNEQDEYDVEETDEFAYYDNLTDEEVEKMIEESKESAEFDNYIKELNDIREPLWKDFADNFVDVQEFIARYREYRQLFFEVDHSSFYNKIEEIIYNYMYEHGLSVFTNDDATFGEFAVLDDMEAKLNTAMRRIRRKHGLFE